MKKIREHGQSQKYYHSTLGHNYRMEGIQGAVLGVKLNYLPEWTNGRRRVAAKYKELLGTFDKVILPKEMPWAKHVYHLYVIRVVPKDQSNRSETRDLLQKYLSDNDIATGLHYPVPLHKQECFKDLGYQNGNFPVTEELAATGLSLPMFPELKDEQINYVADKIKEFFK
jgi:dTDP-4-amino-4,6-dideoxygalactose transaminase